MIRGAGSGPVEPVDFPFVLIKPDGEWVWYTACRTSEEVEEIIRTRGWDKNCRIGKIALVSEDD